MADTNSKIEKTITDYIELQEMSRVYAKKRNDLEKEYNKLLTVYNGEGKNYDLDQADRIYQVYSEMISYEEKLKIAGDSFNEAENKLKEIGRILFEATIHAEISLPAINGTAPHTRSVKVTYNNGEVLIR
jgi:phage terminase large subunit GpA-like protein